MRRRLTPAATTIGLALAVGACGGSSSSNVGIVSKAAVNTSRVRGYRVAGVINISTSGTGTVTTAMGLAGTFNRTNGLGRFLTVGLVNGRRFEVSELVSPLAVYTGASALPNGTRLTGGKPWLKLDVSQAIRASGLSTLPTESDPTQFVDYLRAVSSATSSKGLDVIRGVQAAHYHATIDLDRYPRLVPQAQRATVERSVKALETALSAHTLPVDVWIDQYGLVRRLKLGFDECVSRTRFSFSMTLDLYSYGPQPTPQLPSSRAVYDLTPLISKALSHAKLGCAH